MAAKKRITKNNQASKTKRSSSRLTNAEFGDDADLSPAQRRELEKRIDDLNDRTRYLLASTLGPNFVLYYNLSEDTYGWNDPAHATLFKRRKAAQAIQQLLGDKDSVVECAVDKKGKLDKKSVGKPGRSAKPSSRKKSAKKKSAKKKS